MPRFLICCATLLLLAAPTRAAAPPAERFGKDFHDFVNAVMKEYEIPGVAIAVVRDGKVVLLQGYGYRDLDKQLPVTARTLFAIASITKSFTALAIAMLIDEGKLTYETRVRDVLPGFRLHDTLPTDRVTVRDLLTHRTGLPRHDALWFCTTLDRSQTFDRLRYLEPTADLRERFQYNNLTFTVAGQVVEKVSGKPWEEFVRERILTPLNMKRSNPSARETPRSDDFSLSYLEKNGKVRATPLRDIATVGPGGAISSSAEDMVNYLKLHLDLGRFGDRTLVSKARVIQSHLPQMVVLGSRDSSYGLGLFIRRHGGERLLEHGGSIDGFQSSMALLPDQRAGVIVLTNLRRRDNPGAPTIFAQEVCDRLLGRKGSDYRKQARAIVRFSAKERDDRKAQLEKDRKPDTKPTHALKEMAGRYDNPAYGTLRVEAKGERLKLSLTGLTVVAKHYHHNQFIIIDDETHPAWMMEDRFATFEVGKKGAVDRLLLQTELGVSETVFRRAAK